MGIEQCLFATAKESSRYAINGVLWEVKGKKLILVATDGRRLARCRVDLQQAPAGEAAEKKIIIPARTMGLLQKIGPREKETVAVKFVDNQVLLSCANVVISSNLVEGNFPKYEDIIPADYDKKLTLPTEGALSGVRRAALLTSEESKGIKLSVSREAIVFLRQLTRSRGRRGQHAGGVWGRADRDRLQPAVSDRCVARDSDAGLRAGIRSARPTGRAQKRR